MHTPSNSYIMYISFDKKRYYKKNDFVKQGARKEGKIIFFMFTMKGGDTGRFLRCS